MPPGSLASPQSRAGPRPGDRRCDVGVRRNLSSLTGSSNLRRRRRCDVTRRSSSDTCSTTSECLVERGRPSPDGDGSDVRPGFGPAGPPLFLSWGVIRGCRRKLSYLLGVLTHEVVETLHPRRNCWGGPGAILPLHHRAGPPATAGPAARAADTPPVAAGGGRSPMRPQPPSPSPARPDIGRSDSRGLPRPKKWKNSRRPAGPSAPWSRHLPGNDIRKIAEDLSRFLGNGATRPGCRAGHPWHSRQPRRLANRGYPGRPGRPNR